MINNYTNLGSRSETRLNKKSPDVVGNAPNTDGKLRKSWLLSVLLPLLFLFSNVIYSQTVQIGSGSGTSTGSTAIPITNYVYNYNQQIVTAAEIAAGGGPATGQITKLRYKPTAVGTISVWNNWTVYIGNTTKTSFASTTDWVAIGSMTQVFSGVLSPDPTAGNWFEINFSTPFNYTGGNIVIAVDENTADWTVAPTWSSYTSTTNSGIYYRNDTTNPNPASPPTATGRTATLPQVQFYFVEACPSPSALTSSVTATSATISWGASASAVGYQYEVRTSGAAGSGATGLVASGSTAAGVLSANIAGLSNTTSYNFYVRTDCGGTFSSWPSGSFTTLTPGQIGVGTSTSTNLPIYSCYGYNYSQQIYLASEVSAALTPGNNYITKIRFKPSSLSGLTQANFNNWTVYMGNTSKTSFSGTTDWIALGSMSQVYSATLATMTDGVWIELSLTNPFTWDGTSNLVVAVDENASSYSCTAAWASYAVPATRGLLYYSDGTNPDPASPPTASSTYTSIPQIQLVSTTVPSCLQPNGLVASNVSYTSATIGWSTASGTPVGYNWEVRTSGAGGSGATGLIASGSTAGLTANVSSLSANTTYTFYVQTNCGSSTSPWATSATFYTGYCTVGGTSGTYYLSNFTTSGGATNISNSSGYAAGGYTDYSAQSVSQSAGESINFTVTYNGDPGTRIYIDWNNDLDFNDANEIAFTNGYLSGSVSGSITVPAGTPVGNYRMRVAIDYFSTTPQACGSNTYLDVEDYTFTVIPTPVCNGTPSAGTASALVATFCTSGSTTVSSAGYTVGNSSRYQWESSLDNFATAGTPIGTAASSYSNLNTGTITATTSYRLRVFCSTDNSLVSYSTPVTVTVNNPGTINPVTGDFSTCPSEATTLSVTASESATFAWTAAGGYSDSGSSVTVNPTTTTVYTVTATFANNCTASTTATVTVAPAITVNSVSSSSNTFCGSGSATLTADVSTGSSLTYCDSTHSSGCSGDDVTNVTLGSINSNTSGCGGSSHYTYFNPTTPTTTTTLSPGSSTISVSFGTDGNQYFGAWIDYNQDGSFDTTEFLGASGNAGASGTTSVTFTVPTTALNGVTRLRLIAGNDSAVASNQACGASSSTWGETQDYNVTITGATAAYTFVWSESPVGSTLTSTTANPTTATNINTDKVYTLTATSLYGCTSSNSVSIHVDPVPVVTLASNVTICKGTPATIFIPETGNSYAWSPATGLDTTSGATVVANPTTDTTYSVLITNNTTFCQNTQQITVDVNDPGAITSQPINAVTSTGFGATFSVAGTVGVTYGYQWQRRTATTPAPDGTWVNLTDDYVAPSTGNYTGTNTATLNVFRAGSSPALNNTVYRCILTPPSPCATLVSNNATLTVGTTGITTNPQNVSICLPAPTNPLPQFNVVTNGSTPTTLVWGVSTNGGTTYTNMPMYTISTGVYAGPNTTAVPGLTFALLETSPGVYDYKTLTVAGINASTPNNLRVRVTINTFVVSQPAILNISSPITIDTNLSTTPVNVCYAPTAAPTTLSIATSGSVGTVTWKYATSAAGTYTDVASGTPAGVSYTTSNVGNNYSLTVTTTAGVTPAGNYYFKAFVGSAGVCAGVESNVAVISVTRPTVAIAQSAAAYCNPGGSAITLTASGASSYTWSSNPAGYSNSGAVVSVSPTVSTVYTVTGTDGNGCSNTATATVGVGNSFTLAATPSVTSMCQGSGVNLTAVPTALAGGGTATISFGTNLQNSGSATFSTTLSGIPAGAIITSAQLQLTNVNSINGSYRSEIRVALSGAYSLTATQISTATSGGLISPDPVINLSGFTATSGAINLLLTETYDDSGVDATFGEVKLVIAYSQPATYTYTWTSNPSGFNGSGASTSDTPAVSTTYTVVATSNSGCTATASTTLVSVTPTPVVTSTNNGQPSATRCGTGTLNLTATGSAGAALKWYSASTGGTELATGTTFTTPSLSASTNYWVEASTTPSGSGAAVATSCTPSGGASSTSYYLNNITTTGGISNLAYSAGSYAGYANNLGTTFSQTAGASLGVTLGQSSGDGYYYCWIDWNNDGDFADSGETVFGTTSYTVGYSGVINVPAGQIGGNYRARFAVSYIGSLTSCGAAGYGNYVDFTFVVPTFCTSASRTQVTAVVNPAPALALTASSAAICIGDSTPIVNITPATLGNYTNYTWSPSTFVSGSAASGYSFNPTTTTTYTLSATEPGGCVNSATYVVTVNPRPASTVASTSVASICADFALNLTSSATQILNNTYIDANTNGGFENGATFALNGWTVVNAATNTWQLGSVAGAASGTRGAYISNNGGTSWAYSTGTSQTSHFYRDVVLPAGAQNTTLTFQWKGNGESGWDRLLVYTAPTSVVPVANTPASNSTTLSGATLVWTQPNYSQSGYTTATVNLPNSLAGTTVRLIFTWQNDSSFGTSPAGAVDNISLTGTVSDALTYSWTSTPAGFTSGVQNPTNVVPSVNGIVYNVTVQNSFGCTSQASTAPVTVYPTPTAVAPANQLYYNGLATAAIPLSGTPSGVTFDISGGAAIGLANVNGVTAVPSFVPTVGTATVSITPKANGCTGQAVTYNIVVTAVNANPIANQEYCAGMNTAAIPLSSTPATVAGNTITYNMNVVGDDIGLYSATGLTAIPSFLTKPGTATVTVYPVYGGVFGGAVSATITVNPLPTASVSGTTQVCRNDSSPLITFTGANGTAPYTFTYKLNAGTNQTIVSTGNVATIAVPTSAAGTFTYTLISVQDSSSTTCSQAQGGYASVIVHPTPTVVAPANQVYYSGFATAPIPLSGTPSGVTFNISGGAAAGLPNMNGITTIPSFIPTTTPATVTITPVANGCTGISVTYQISFNPVIVNIDSNVCGSVNNGLNNQINCTQVSIPGIVTTGYQFEITNTDTGVVSIVQSSQHHFKLTDADNYAYGTTFTIRVAAILNGNVQGYFGNTCSLTTASVATTKVVTAQCGSTLIFINSTINANSVASTNLYRFRVALATAPTTYYYVERTVPNFKLTDVVGLPLLFDTEYKVDVQIRVKLAGFEAWSQYGQRCSIFTPAAPETSLVASQCEDYQVPSYATVINAIAFPGATKYRFLLTSYDEFGDISYQQSVDSTTPSFTLSMFTGLTPSTTYTVSVAMELFGTFTAYGKDCSIITPASARIMDPTIVQPFQAVAHPNPFATNFMLDVKTSSTSVIAIKVYDMVGRLVEERTSSVTELENATIGDRYPSGVYNIVVSQDDIVQTVRVVKR